MVSDITFLSTGAVAAGALNDAALIDGGGMGGMTDEVGDGGGDFCLGGVFWAFGVDLGLDGGGILGMGAGLGSILTGLGGGDASFGGNGLITLKQKEICQM